MAVQVPPDSTMAWPRASVAAQEVVDAQEIAVSTFEGSAATLDENAPSIMVMTEPSSAVAKQVLIAGHETAVSAAEAETLVKVPQLPE